MAASQRSHAGRGKESAAERQALVLSTLRACSLIGRWPLHCIETLASHGRLERYPSGAQVLARDPRRREIFVVASGCIELSHSTEKGKKFLLGLLGRGETIGLARLLPEVQIVFSHYAHGETALVHLPVEAMRGVLDSEPILWRDIAMVALGRMLWNVALVREQALSTLSQRTAGALVSLSRLQGVQESGNLQFRLSQDELGTLLGVSRQSANKELRALEEAGVIRAEYNRIAILDMTKLIDLAGGPAFNPASAL